MTNRRNFLKNGLVSGAMTMIGCSGAAFVTSVEAQNKNEDELKNRISECTIAENFIREKIHEFSIPRRACINLIDPDDETYFKLKDYNVITFSEDSINTRYFGEDNVWKIVDRNRFEGENNSITQEISIEVNKNKFSSTILAKLQAEIENRLFFKALDEKGLVIPSWKECREFFEKCKAERNYLYYEAAFLIANHETIKNLLEYHEISKDFEVRHQSNRSNCIGFLGGIHATEIIPGRFRRMEIIENELVDDDKIYLAPQPEKLGFFWVSQDFTILPYNDGTDKHVAYSDIGLILFT